MAPIRVDVDVRFNLDMWPATRYGRWVVFKGGHSRRLGLFEYLRIVLGIQKTVSP